MHQNLSHRKRLIFWGKDADDDSLARNVIAGKKTATASIASEYGKPYSDYGDSGYVVGDIVEVYDPKKRLRCLIRIIDVYPVKFGSIPEKVWRGEDFRSEEEFREVHIRCMPNHRLHDDFEFMIVEFQLHEVVMEKAPDQATEPTTSAAPAT